jgi:NADH:ubiquinone oxidoreductase subunit K
VLLAIAASEVALGFGLIIFGYRKTGTIDLNKYTMLNDGVDPKGRGDEFDAR